MTAEIDLIVPMKPPGSGKTRLRGNPVGDDRHVDLVVAMADDTLTAACATGAVRSLLLVTSAPETLTPLREHGAEVLDEAAAGGLNPALCRAERSLRARHPHGVIGVLQADLPALRARDLRDAVTDAGNERAFTADRHGTGTTLLLSAPGNALWPHFGPGSARAHVESGARALGTPAPTLRCDVDTPADLTYARELGVGNATTVVLHGASKVP